MAVFGAFSPRYKVQFAPLALNVLQYSRCRPHSETASSTACNLVYAIYCRAIKDISFIMGFILIGSMFHNIIEVITILSVTLLDKTTVEFIFLSWI